MGTYLVRNCWQEEQVLLTGTRLETNAKALGLIKNAEQKGCIRNEKPEKVVIFYRLIQS
jgi:hypothetical protein